MINAFNIFENATDYEKGLFMAALDKRISDLPLLYDYVPTRVKEREKAMILKEKFNAGVYGFSYDQLASFQIYFSFYVSDADTINLDDAAREKLLMTSKKYSRQIEDLLDEYHK